MEYIEIGKIVNTFGIKGELKIKPYTDFDRFAKNKRIFVLLDGEYFEEKVTHSRFLKDYYYIGLKNYTNINEVLKYKGCLCFIKREDREELGENEYYFSDLENLEVRNEFNVFKGKVKRVIEYPQCAYLEVLVDEKKTKLVPFLKEFIVSVDKEKIIIKEIEGLL